MKRKIIFTICIIIIAIFTVGFFIRNGQHKGKNGQAGAFIVRVSGLIG